MALTLVLGRVYCSVICPLGVMQDCISWLSGRRKKKKYRFSYSPAKNWWRYTVLGLFIIAMIAGVGSFVALLAPYSSYGRIVWNLLGPVYDAGNNLLAKMAEHFNSYAFYEKEVWIRSIPTFIIAAGTFVALFILAWRNGRTYCNTVSARANARARASTARTARWTTAAAWHVWTASTPAHTMP